MPVQEFLEKIEEKCSSQKQPIQEEPSHFEAVIRNLILKYSHNHGCYDIRNHLVALPVVVFANTPNPNSKIHWRCPYSPEPEDWELEAFAREDQAIMHWKM